MSDGAPVVGRFVCRACGRLHAKWWARCSNCDKDKGLERVTTEAPMSVPEPAPAPKSASVPAPVLTSVSLPTPEAPEPTRPYLSIVRAEPEPSLEDPAQELAEVAEEDADDDDDDDLIPLSEITTAEVPRDSTGLAPLDYVLGGGLARGSVVLLASPPGIGKSSLSLQMLDGLGHRCLYVTGEETREQIATTARRIGVASDRIFPLAERSLDKIFAKARAKRPQTIAIDSIQKMICEDVNSRPGSPTQLKECTARLVQHAKETGTTIWIIGHVTNDGDVAGPRTIEHDVDVVLELEQGARFEGNERILRCNGKNRFGAANLVGYFEITDRGFAPVDGDGWNEEGF